LVFEVTTNDPGATMVSPRAAAVPSISRPLTPPPPPPADYVGSVPASPAPAMSAPASTPIKRTNILPIIIGVAVLFFVCLCVGVLWYIDANFLWCTFFPFLGGC
ncbi:MAG: hypothetical protein HGA79_09500, partial [Anaerolineales bacterium]|nr:hypothetical protein [Anaerolineales bacterium]